MCFLVRRCARGLPLSAFPAPVLLILCSAGFMGGRPPQIRWHFLIDFYIYKDPSPTFILQRIEQKRESHVFSGSVRMDPFDVPHPA